MTSPLPPDDAECLRAPQGVSAAEVRYRRLFESARVGILILDSETGRVTDVNPYLADRSGYAREELIGREIWTTGLLNNALQDEEAFRELKDNDSISFECHLSTATGQLEPAELLASADFIDDRRVIECTIRGKCDGNEPERLLKVHYSITRVLSESATLAEAATRIVKIVLEQLGWELGVIWTLDHQAQSLHWEGSWHRPNSRNAEFEEATRRLTFVKGQGLPGQVWSAGKPIWIVDAIRDLNSPRAGVAAKVGLHAAFGFPLLVGDRVLGVMEFFRSEIRQLDEELLEMMSDIGGQVGQFIDRKRAESATCDSEAQKTAIMESSLDAIVTMDHEGKIIEFNPAAERMFGYSQDDVIGRELAAVIVPASLREQHRQGLENYLVSGASVVLNQRIEITAMRSDESEFPVELTIMAIRSEGPPRFAGFIRDIEVRKRAEEELRLKTVFLEAQMDSSIDGILVVNPQGKKILQNRHVSQLWKIPQHIIDNDDDMAQVEHVLSAVKDPEKLGKQIAHLYAHPDETDRTEIELKDGSILDRYSAPVIGPDGQNYGRIWTFRDVTERKRGEEALRESEERLRMLTESMPQLVWVCELDGWNIFFNQRWVDYTGLSLEESHGHGWTQAFHPEDQTAGSHANEASAAYEVECRLRRADGVYRWFLVRGLPLRDSSGKIDRWFGTCTDIHDLKSAEEALLVAQEELEARVAERTADLTLAIEEADRANRAKSEFLSRMSHELRTPLNAILGFGQLLEMGDLSPSEKESVHLILKGGRHLLGLVNEILDIAGVEAGRIELSLEPISLGDLVPECCDLVSPLAAKRKVRLEMDAGGFRDCHVMADNLRLKQVLINLLSNGIKYNQTGGTLEVACHRVSGERMRIEIRDSGRGIPPDDLRKLFTPFERLGAAKSDIEGSGLGLVLAQHLVSAMGGTLEVASVVGQGTTFFFDLPLAAAPTSNLPVPAPDAELSAAPLRTYSVLCIEDNPSNLRLIEAILRSRPEINLVVAMQGSSGCDLACQHVPDVVLLDLNLPDMSGKEVMARLKGSPITKRIPVVFISADVTPSQIEQLLTAGAFAYLTKPLDVKEFLRTLDCALGSEAA